MGTALPALAIHQPDFGDQLTRAVQLRSLLGGQQLQQLQIQQQQLQLRDQQIFRQAFVKNNGDLDATAMDAAKMGASPQTVQALQQHAADMKLKNAQATNAELDTHAKQVDNLRGALQPVFDAPDEQKANLWQFQRQKVIDDPKTYGNIAAEQIPEQFPGKDTGQFLMTALTGQAKQLAEEKERRELTLKETAAKTQAAEAALKTKEFEATLPGGAKENPEQKYIRLQSSQRQGQQLSDADKTWMQGYEKNKTMVPAFNFNLQSTGAGPTNTTAANTGKTGQDYLSTLSPARQIEVRSYVEGRRTFPGGAAQRNPYFQRLYQDVLATDPDWNEQRAQLRKSFFAGPDKKNIDAINTALGHADTLGNAIPALDAGNLPALNAIAQKIGVAIGKDPVTTFKTIVHRLGPELAQAYGEGTGSEREKIEKDLDPALGRQQLENNLRETVGLLRSKIGSMENRWNQAKGDSMPAFEDQFITPLAKQSLQQWGPKVAEGATQRKWQNDGKGNYRFSDDGGKTWQEYQK